ncbi:unnamed protein product [Bathycoccus prasinos]|mmetsp:Transcript_8016/g.26441  ORF Transcript_8016/g.26441 Transcript_8016/m.26441 type:complete len:117 (+) Transcript_8016:104-454(+)
MMRRKPCLLRSTWPEEEEKNDLNVGARDAPPQKVTLLNRMEVRRRVHSIPLSKILALDECRSKEEYDEYRRELGEFSIDDADKSAKEEETLEKEEEVKNKKKEEEAMLDDLLDDDD